MAKNILNAKIATPYAQALLDIAKEKRGIHSITCDINNLRALLDSNKMLADSLANPLLSVEAKRKIIEKAISPEVSEQTSKFLMLLLDRKRINYLEAINERFLELVYELANIKIVEVTSANVLTKEQEDLLIDKLQVMTSAKEIKLVITLDSTLIGGFLIKTNSQIIDLTIKGQLKELAKHLDSVLEM
jgi:F-type H+-transporting ATPase subunit delta